MSLAALGPNAPPHLITACVLCLNCYATHAAQPLYTPRSAEECRSYSKYLPAGATEQDMQAMNHLNLELAMTSSFRYVADRDSILTDMKKTMGEGVFISKLDSIKKNITPAQVSYIAAFVGYREAFLKGDIKKYLGKDSQYEKYARGLTGCSFESLYKLPDPGTGNMIAKFVDASTNARGGKFGNFHIGLESCEVTASVDTASRYSKPEQWDGSQFIVLDARFKNLDTEGRLPGEGTLIIKTPDGKELRYDTTESIMQRGYGIYFKSVNPLVTMPTKIVYRIPTDISGEVYWEPGRNPEKKRLWCTFMLPKS